MTAALTAEQIAVACGEAKREGNGWRCLCPAHNDHNPSLSLTDADGKVLFKCRTGCSQDEVISAFKDRELWFEPTQPRIMEEYDYRDENGKVRYQVVRMDPKSFRQRRPDGRDGWIWNRQGIEPLPYRLPELIKSSDQIVFIAEGEKDCDNLAKIGTVATCNSGGAGNWNPSLNQYFRGRDVVILPDNDEPGRRHANNVAENLHSIAKRVRVVALPGLDKKGDVSDWIASGGTAKDLYQLVNGTEKWSRSQSVAKQASQDVPENVIIMRRGDRPEIIDRAQRALLSEGASIYQRGGKLIRPAVIDHTTAEKDEIRRPIGSTVLIPVNKYWLTEQMARVVRWAVPSEPDQPKLADPKIEYAQFLLARQGEWIFSVLRGVVSAPTLARDGRIIQQPGYDPLSGLLLNFSAGSFPLVPEEPTFEAAKKSLKKLAHPLRGFPFVTESDRSVALSALLTALIRPSLRTAPLHAFASPTAGTGKSKLAEMAGILATGFRPPSMSQGKTPDEDEKRLSTVLREGDSIILIDNCERALGGDFLCSMLTQETVQARILGLSERMILPSTALVIVNGNNLTLEGDLSRRSVNCLLDAKVERPDERLFDFDCQAEVIDNRAELIVCGLTALRAYVVAGRPMKLTPMGGFDDWDIVRGTLVWLGYSDPANTREAIVANDPRKEELIEVMEVWQQALGEKKITLAEIDRRTSIVGLEVDRARGVLQSDIFLLRQALIEATGRPTWNARAAGKFLRRNKSRVVGGYYFESAHEGNHQKWWLAKINKPLGLEGI